MKLKHYKIHLDENILKNEQAQKQKQILGEKIYPIIAFTHPQLSGKILQLILQNNNDDLLAMINDKYKLQQEIYNRVQQIKLHYKQNK